MAETGWRRIESFASGEIQSREWVDNFVRTNNNLRINGLRSEWRATVGGNHSGVWTRTYLNGVERVYKHYGNPSWGAWNVFYGDQAWFDISVGANDTTIYTSTSWGAYDGAWNNGDRNIAIPALGSPSVVKPTLTTRGDKSLTINTSTGSNWGANANNDGGWWRTEYKEGSSSTWLNLGNKSGNVTNNTVNIPNLKSNTTYNVRTRMRNGGGKESVSSNMNATTIANAVGTIKEILAANFIANIKPTQGQFETTAYVQYRKKGDTSWIGSENKVGADVDINVIGLLPSNIYEYRFAVDTEAGTWVSGISELTTLPAAKLVYPDGTVKNAIPWAIYPNGDKKMLDVKLIKE